MTDMPPPIVEDEDVFFEGAPDAPEEQQPAGPPAFEHGRSDSAGQVTDEGEARIFPCEGCGADLEFHIGAQRLKCPYCGYEKTLQRDPDREIKEQDFHAALAVIAEQRLQKSSGEQTGDDDGTKEVRCESCGGQVQFQGTLTSSECAFCGSPIQLEKAHVADDRIPVDAVLPFQIDHKTATENLRAWVKSRWFAPNEFKKRGVKGQFNGIYLPYWTFDSLTYNIYSGQRGEYYYVTVGSGKNKRRVRRTRWYPASGEFERFFDDVLVVAAMAVPWKLIQKLEPWPLAKMIPFTKQVLAGHLAQTYDVELDAGFQEGKRRMEQAIDAETRRRIGGDTQQVHSIDSSFDPITYKHVLLPVWLLAYKYGEKSYRIAVNAGTGEVQGERPYSWIKITLAALGGAAAAAVGGLIFANR